VLGELWGRVLLRRVVDQQHRLRALRRAAQRIRHRT
jgi:hypothetical protein